MSDDEPKHEENLELKNETKQEEKINLEFSKTTLWQIISGVLAVLLVVSILTNGFGFGNGRTGAVVKDDESNPTVDNGYSIFSGSVLDVNADVPYLGSKDAKITIIEYSDFQCPYCKAFHTQAYPKLRSQYIDSNKIKFIYKDFPLVQIHENAQSAAEAANCAQEQEKFWEYHGLLFDNQQALSLENYKKWAKEIGLNEDKFNSCLDSGKYNKDIDKDTQEIMSFVPKLQLDGVGTPSFLIITDKNYPESKFLDLEQSQYSRNIKIAKNKEGNTIIFLSGALPFEAFDSILSRLT